MKDYLPQMNTNRHRFVLSSPPYKGGVAAASAGGVVLRFCSVFSVVN